MIPRLIIACILLIFGTCAYAQTRSLFIDSLKINPVMPGNQDSILLQAYIELPWYTNNETRYSDTIVYNDSEIVVSSCYILGASPVYGNLVDSFYLGVLPSKTYQLKYLLHMPFYYEADTITDCNKYPYYDSASINFNVLDVSGFKNVYVSEVSLYPNPTNNILQVQHSLNAPHLEILSVEGRLVYSKDEVTSGAVIDIKNLSPGLYFLALRESNRRIVVKFNKL